MIVFNYLYTFNFENSKKIIKWISKSIDAEFFKEGDIDIIFCDDDLLSGLHVKHLKTNILTDVLTFDYTIGKELSADIFISIERIMENSKFYKTTFSNELHRVIIHGILHLCAYNDKTKKEKQIMKQKEDYYLSLLNLY